VIERLAQLAVIGVLHHRHVGGRVQGELPALLVIFLRRLARGLQDILWNSPGLLFIHVNRKSVGRIQQVLGKLRRQPGELFLNRGVAALLVGRQLGAAEAEIAQGILDDFFSGRRQGRKFG
jgi:hypothetical protein